MGLRNAGDFARQLLAAIEAHPSISIVSQDLQELDVSILQVLVSAQKTAARSGKAMTLSAPRDGVLFRTLAKAGFIAPDGTPRTAEAHSWIGAAGGTKGSAA